MKHRFAQLNRPCYNENRHKRETSRLCLFSFIKVYSDWKMDAYGESIGRNKDIGRRGRYAI